MEAGHSLGQVNHSHLSRVPARPVPEKADEKSSIGTVFREKPPHKNNEHRRCWPVFFLISRQRPVKAQYPGMGGGSHHAMPDKKLCGQQSRSS